MYGRVRTGPRHLSRRSIPASVTLALIVTALLVALALGAALLPASFTGPGAPAEQPAAAVGMPGADRSR